ncbi:ATP-binding protein [Photobacterium leiognathi]|uniref:ATP-binding protein n=1 Tax=Photobacterium leiognathi TaxID=553611 RepID=UPI0029813A6E|nr:ATP-binding protein [Photobacterium leiognathi]
MNKEITLKIGNNTNNYLKTLTALFPNPDSVISELLQNCRRAGASSVSMIINADNNTITIEDNGCGIDNFQQLFTTTESGWSSQTQSNENAFGIGFIGILFACEHFEIFSKDQYVKATCTDIFNPETLERNKFRTIKNDIPINGTKIVMHNTKSTKNLHNNYTLKHNLIQLVRNIYRCYPVDLNIQFVINNEQIETDKWKQDLTPKSLNNIDNINTIKTEIGDIYINEFEQSTSYTIHQGFIIHCNQIPYVHAINLNDNVKASFPIRTTLVDERDIYHFIKSSVKHHFQNIFLPTKKKELSDDIFTEKYTDMCIYFGVERLLDSKFVPSQSLVNVESLENLYNIADAVDNHLGNEKPIEITDEFLSENIIISTKADGFTLPLLSDLCSGINKNIWVVLPRKNTVSHKNFILNSKTTTELEINNISGEVTNSWRFVNQYITNLIKSDLIFNTNLGKITLSKPITLNTDYIDSLCEKANINTQTYHRDEVRAAEAAFKTQFITSETLVLPLNNNATIIYPSNTTFIEDELLLDMHTFEDEWGELDGEKFDNESYELSKAFRAKESLDNCETTVTQFINNISIPPYLLEQDGIDNIKLKFCTEQKKLMIEEF